ncbi:MAG: type VI secretion protein [Oscillospiraceae bacterium]
MNPEAMMKKARAANFVENNGKVLRGINMLRIDYNKLSSIRAALGIDKDEYADSVNYLIESGYIRIRHIDTQKTVELADYHMDEIEGKLTQKGIQLLAGVIDDPCVTV